ncbi:MAG: hypothetical protein ABSH50_29505 [Bryobacteraceae bacterium]|jgi:hypothetical protein
MIRLGFVSAACLFAVSLPASEIPPDTGVPVSVPVTIQERAGAPAHQLTPDDILVSQNKQRRQIISMAPIDRSAGIELWILIDDGLTKNFGTQLSDVKQFVMAQPPATRIGIGYIRNGMVEKAQAPTPDHALAAHAMRLPTGPAGISADPYSALKDLIHKWPATTAAREVLLVSNGVDPDYGSGPQDPYLDSAIQAAQRAGVVVYTIYYPGSGLVGRAGRQVFWGQNYLAQLSQETGGEMYWIGPQAPVSLISYFDDLGRRLNGQYLLTFLAKPENKAGLRSVEIKSELPHVKLAAPSQVYVPAIQ